MTAKDWNNTLNRICEWNGTRLELFRISEPNIRREFHGVVRFFFQTEDQKYQAKCLRISNFATACQLVNVLVEKFHPDLKTLTAGRFALYEYTDATGERRLGANEAPLLVQLNYAFDDQEVRFILRDESKPLSSNRQQLAFENQPGALQPRVGQKPLLSAGSAGDPKADRGFTRRWSSGSRKEGNKQRSAVKLAEGGVTNGVAGGVSRLPESSFTRTLSNPDEVQRRRKQQRSQHRSMAAAEERATNAMKIYGEVLNNEVPFVTLSLSTDDTAERIVQWTLEKYGFQKQVHPQDLCLVQVNIPPRGTQLPLGIDREITLHNQDCPLAIRNDLNARSLSPTSLLPGLSCVFQIRYRQGELGRSPPPPAPFRPRFPPAHGLGTPNGSLKQSRSSINELAGGLGSPREGPHLKQVNTVANEKDALVISLTELFTRQCTSPIKIGTIEKMVGPPPNVLIDKMVYQDIRPIHCTLSVAQVSASTPRIRHPKACQPGELEAVAGTLSLLITPSLDGFAKPPGPAVVRLDGARITGPAVVQPNSLIQLGKQLVLKYVASFLPTTPSLSDERRDTGLGNNGGTLPRGHEKQPAQDARSPGSNFASLPRRPVDTRAEPNEYASQRSLNADTSRQSGRGQASDAHAQPQIYGSPDHLPLGIVLTGGETAEKTNLLDRYLYAVDRILAAANAEIQILSGVSPRGENRSAIFSLSPAYALYLLYRACLRQLASLSSLGPSEQDQEVSYLTNFIATRVYESLPHPDGEERQRIIILHHLVYWLANSSELLYFFKNDIDLSGGQPGNQKTATTTFLLSPVHMCRPALNLLADSVDDCFHQLKSLMTMLLQPLLFSLINPGEDNREEETRYDDKPITTEVYASKCRETTSLQPLLQLLSLLMQLLRRMRVNAAITIQLFSHVYHVMAAFVFNQSLINTSAKPRHQNAEEIPSLWLTKSGAKRLLRRLERIKQWAQRQGLERAAECRFQRCVQACQLILADRTNLDNLYEYCMGLLSLNSLQLEWLLSHLADTPSVSEDWIDIIVTGGREVNDRAAADEMHHYYQEFQPCDLAPGEIQLTEIKELPFPLFLPPDGYASDTVLNGIPSGLKDFLQSLANKGLLLVKKNPMDPSLNNVFPWTNYFRLSKTGNSDQALEDQSHQDSAGLPPPTTKLAPAAASKPGAADDESSDSEVTSSEEEEEDKREEVGQHRRTESKEAGTFKVTGRSGQYRPAPPAAGKLYQRRQHSSLPDLTTTSELQSIATQAGVPVSSVTRVYLKKLNNSLGLSIVAAKAEGQHQYGIYIKEIVPGGAADRHGGLETGDQILLIGSANLIGCAQSEAVATIAKHSQMQDGAHLTLSKKAAQRHNIIDLIRSPGVNGSVNDASRSDKPTKTGAQKQSQDGKYRLHREYNESPNRHQSAEARKPGALVTAPSTRVGVRHRDDEGPTGSHSTQKTPEARGTGTLSRSTPSLNLAEVGVDDFRANSPVQQDSLPKMDKNDRPRKPKDLPRRDRAQYDTDSDEKPMQPMQSPSTVSSGSDVPPRDNNHPSFDRQESLQKYAASGRKPVKNRPDRASHDQARLQASRSQPNISGPGTEPINTTVRRNSDGELGQFGLPDQGLQLEESLVSNAFSSLESVSTDEQTPCSLNESSGAFEPQPTGQVEKDLPVAPVITKGRIEHPPPPRAPISGKPPPARSLRQDHEKEHANAPRAKTYSSQRRNDDRKTQQSSLEPSSHGPSLSEGVRGSTLPKDASVKQTSSGLPVYRPQDHAKASAPDQLSAAMNDHGSFVTSSLSSLKTASLDTLIENNLQKRDLPPREVSMDTSVTQTGWRNASPTKRPGLASHNDPADRQTPSHVPLSVNVDDRQNLDALRPPSHAVIPGDQIRWPEECNKSPVPLQDLPALRSDPQQGRPRVNRKPFDSTAPVPTPISSRTDRYPANAGIHTSGTPNPMACDQRGLSTVGKVSHINPSYDSSAATRKPPPTTLSMAVPSRRSPTLPASPPPIPTADFPQYHPPERLEPSEWGSNDGRHRVPASSLSTHNGRRELGNAKPVAPEPAPRPGEFYCHRPVSQTKYNTLPEQPPAKFGQQLSLDGLHSASRPTDPTAGHFQRARVVSPSLWDPTPSSAAARVAQLESELAVLEGSNQPAMASTLDRLRVELRFQRRLAERESSRRISQNRAASSYEELAVAESRKPTETEVESQGKTEPGPETSGQIWHQKRIEADLELEQRQQNRLAQLEAEHQEMLKRQEIRSKERVNWLFERKQQTDTRSFSAGELEVGSREQAPSSIPFGAGEDAHPLGQQDAQPRYGRPRFDLSVPPSTDVQLTAGRSGLQVVELQVPRPAFTDSIRVKKSVSFDKNLETISVYSPPTTPRDSISEQHRQPATPSAMPMNAFHFPMPPELTSSRLGETPAHMVTTKVPVMSGTKLETGLQPRPTSIIKAPSPTSPMSPNQVPNAELLPFKEKMRLFAEQLGEELPKERSRMSSRQRQLLVQPSLPSPQQNRRPQLSSGGAYGAGSIR